MAATECSPRPKSAFITGITGQDGSYLVDILLEKGYQVHGLVRPSSQRRQFLSHPLRRGITLHYGDMTDSATLMQILSSITVDEVYHLAAQSHVAVSFQTPLLTCDINALGTLRLLEVLRILGLEKKVKFYSAVTSELFGNEAPAPQTEETPMAPVSPYAVSKLFQYAITANFREAYGFHASNGILFNHESPRRGTTFVTRKITTQVALIACGLSESFELGNLNATRDWGHARDYMEGVWMMLQQPEGQDYVLATGQASSVRDFVEAAFKVIGTKIEWSGKNESEMGTEVGTGKVRVRVNPEFYRPVENENLLGSAAKAKAAFGWEPKYTLETLVEEMVLSDIELVKSGRMFSTTNLDWLIDRGVEESENRSVVNSAPSSTAGDTYKASDGWSTSGVEGSEQTECSSVAEAADLPGSEKVEFALIGAAQENVNMVVIDEPPKTEAGGVESAVTEQIKTEDFGDVDVATPFTVTESTKMDSSILVEPATPSTVSDSETTVNLSITIDSEGRVTKVYNVSDLTVGENITLPTAVSA
ncbi:GDP-mannose 4,6-dehydratase sdnI [Naviculisporaceae sp. PSN 640]